MTIALAVTDGTTTWIASDTSRTLSTSRILDDPTGKWTEVAGWHVATTGDHRAAWLFGGIEVPDLGVRELVEAIRQRLLDDGWEPRKTPADAPILGSDCILAAPGEVWFVGADWAPVECPPGTVAAAGCGDQLALGAIHVCKGWRWGWPDVLKKGIEAACQYSPYCRGYWSKTLELRASDWIAGHPPEEVPTPKPKRPRTKTLVGDGSGWCFGGGEPPNEGCRPYKKGTCQECGLQLEAESTGRTPQHYPTLESEPAE